MQWFGPRGQIGMGAVGAWPVHGLERVTASRGLVPPSSAVRVEPGTLEPLQTSAGAHHLPPLGGPAGIEQASQGARLLRTRDPAAIDAVEELLRTGPIRWDGRKVGSVDGNYNGELALVRVGEGARQLDAVYKPPDAMAAQESFAWQGGRLLGIDHTMAAAARRDRGVLIEFVPGAPPPRSAYGSDIVEEHLRSWYSHNMPWVADGAARAAARTDLDLMRASTFVLGNEDVHGGNVLLDAARGGAVVPDNGHLAPGRELLFEGEPVGPPLRHFVLRSAGDRSGVVKLGDEAREWLAVRLDPAALRELHATELANESVQGLNGERLARLQAVQRPGYVDGVIARWQHLVDTGAFRYAEALPDVRPRQHRG